MTATAPPRFAIANAVTAACNSPCAKSKRGAAIFRVEPFCIMGVGLNSQPEPFVCTADERCRASCGKLCAHAEQRAIRDALRSGRWPNRSFPGGAPSMPSMRGHQIVHAKVVDGQLVAGGGPSCLACSVAILDVQLDGVWLYEDIGAICDARDEAGTICSSAEHSSRGDVTCARWREGGVHPTGGEWRYRTAEDFHRATLAHHRIDGGG